MVQSSSHLCSLSLLSDVLNGTSTDGTYGTNDGRTHDSVTRPHRRGSFSFQGRALSRARSPKRAVRRPCEIAAASQDHSVPGRDVAADADARRRWYHGSSTASSRKRAVAEAPAEAAVDCLLSPRISLQLHEHEECRAASSGGALGRARTRRGHRLAWDHSVHRASATDDSQEPISRVVPSCACHRRTHVS